MSGGWLVFVFVSALTESFHDMIVSQTVSFRFTSHPDVSGFFVFNMAELAIPEAAIQKLGHAFSFLCSPICFQGAQAHEEGGAVCIGRRFPDRNRPALFGRNGCLRDVLIDSLGIAAFCALQRKKHTAKHTKPAVCDRRRLFIYYGLSICFMNDTFIDSHDQIDNRTKHI